MFKRLTVDSILKPVTKAIAQLEAVREENVRRAEVIDEQINVLYNDRSDVLVEVDRATRFRDKLQSLLDD